LEGCSRTVNVVSSINRVIPCLLSKDQEQILTGSHYATPSQFLHAFSYTMVEPNTGFVFDFNELVEDDPVDCSAPVD
jgi:hypothetical protein